MKSYTITVNGNVYDVTVEEQEGNSTGSSSRKAAPAAAPGGSRSGSRCRKH